MKNKTWLILLAIATVLLLAYGGKVTSAYFSDIESSTNNVLRVKSAPLFGSADNFTVLSYAGIPSTGTASIIGDIGVSPTTGATIGVTCAEVTGTIYTVDAAGPACRVINPTLLTAAMNDLTTAYLDAAGRTPIIIGTELGGTSPVPGVYAAGTFGITGTLTLTGDANAVWIFQAASTLTTAAGSQVILSGGAKASNVYWVVVSSATLGANSSFKGNIMALASITMYGSAVVEGRALAQTGSVTLNANTITRPAP
jgi:predicted ribosomally synthesized peptide with SipW-like signal peptide